MTDLDISAKSDRELLIMVVDKLNNICNKVERHDKWLSGNGIPGMRFQVWVLWAVFLAVVGKLWAK